MLEHTANKSLYYEWNKLSIISAAKIKLAEIRTQFGSIISVQISKDREIFSIDIDDGIEFRIHEPPISFRCPKCNQPKLRTFEARLVTLNEVIIEGIGKNCLFEKI